MVMEGEAETIAKPDRLIALAATFGTEILGEYGHLMTGGLAMRTATMGALACRCG